MSVDKIKVRIHVVRDSTHAGIYQLIAAEYGRVSLGILFDNNSVNSSIAVELNTSLFRGEKLIKKTDISISSSKVWNHQEISKIPSGRVGAS